MLVANICVNCWINACPRPFTWLPANGLTAASFWIPILICWMALMDCTSGSLPAEPRPESSGSLRAIQFGAFRLASAGSGGGPSAEVRGELDTVFPDGDIGPSTSIRYLLPSFFAGPATMPLPPELFMVFFGFFAIIGLLGICWDWGA